MEKQNDQKIKSKIDIKKGKAKNVELPSQQSRTDSKQQAVSILQLFRFATKLDYLFMILGLLGAIAAACAMPIFQILWAIATLQFRDSENAVDTLIKFIYFGAILFVGIITMMFFWGKTGHRQTQKCKRAYFNSLLKKKVSWYDINDHNRIISSFSRQISAYKAAVSNKVAILCLTIASFFTKTGVGLYYGWYLTLMLLIGFPLLVISSLLFRRFEQKKTKVQLNQYSKADARCQQAIGNIETVKILNGENYQVQRYKRLLQLAEEKTLKYGYINGLNLGLLSFLVITMYAWGFYYGSLLLQNNVYNPNSITGDYLYNAGIIVSLTNLITVQIYQVIQFYPTLNYIQQAKVAARKIYNIIDDVQNNQTIQQNAIIPNQFNAKIRFHEVTFAYPKNKNKKILDKVSFQINQNTVAIIGQSGCGKSTIFQLLTRLYQPDQGKIYIDQIDIKLINLSWLRNQISFVIQQPPLHFGTIRDNMLFANPQASQQDMINSLQIAEAWNFVNQYKQKLDTKIGQGGSLLSGGQKQRVAIAQALVKKPKILLMDQATSALDKRNQQIIQARILNLNNRPKILFIAHRQTTIRSASTFILIENMKANKINISQIKELQIFQEFPQTLFIQKKQSKQLKNNQESKRKVSSQKEAGFLQLVHRNNFKSDFGKQKSQTQSELYNQAPQQQQKEEEVSIIKRLLAYSMKQKKVMFVSFVAILATVAMYPMFGIFIGKAIAILLLFPSNQIQFRSSINGVVLAIFLIAIGAFISKAVEHSCFSYIGSKITKQIRIDTYNKIMRMPLQNFDSYSLNKGTVSSLFSYRLSIDALRLNSLTTSHIGILMEVALILITGFTISIIFQYRIGCLMLGFLPFIFFFSFLQMSFNDEKNQGVLQNSILSQALNNIKMIYAYNRQAKFQSQLNDAIRLSQKGSLRGIIISSLLFGLSQYSIFIFFGLILFISIQIFSASPQTSVENVLIAIFSCWIGALSAGTQFYYIPDAVKAQKSAKNILQILSQQDEDQKQIKQGSQMINEIDIKSIVFKDVFFSYSSEKTDRMILQNFNLQIYKRDYLTIVGQSGSGKSTFWKLILRLYDPLEGQVLINGLSAKQYDIHALRRKFGVVNQQPQLFNDNIMDNIKYSQKDTPVKQVFEVCKRVNAWNFILNKKEQKDTLQDSLQVLVNPVSKRGQQNDADLDQQQILKCFSRNLGSNGSHISGGQKQRIAIARALIRKPQVIILDQATSALDKINSMVAKKAIKDTRSINIKLEITHNLNSISGEQQVIMIHKGSIKEKGKKQVLKGKNGFFQKLTLGKKIISPF